MLKKNSTAIRLFAGVSVSATCLSPSVLFAQDGDAASSGSLPEVVVTAQKREGSLQSTPVSVTAISGQEMLKSGILDTMELDRLTPNLDVTRSGGGHPFSPQVGLRGQHQNALNITNDPSVGLYIDDIYVGKDVGSITDFFDVQRIEVLKGPQGTLYGRNTPGGAIKYISNRPDLSGMSGLVRAGYGDYDDLKLQGMINIPMGGNAAIRYAGSYREHDGYTETTYYDPFLQPVRTEKTDDLTSQLHRFSFLTQPSENLSLLLVADYHDKKSNGYLSYNTAGEFLPLVLAGLPINPVSQEHLNNFYAGVSNLFDASGKEKNPEATAKGWGLALTADWQTNDNLNTKLILGYRDNKTQNLDLDVEGSVLPLVDSSTLQDFQQFSSELQLSGLAMDGKLNWIGGFYYFNEKGDDETNSFFLVPPFAIHQRTFGAGKNESFAVYGHGIYELGADTTVQAGLRYTIDNKSMLATGNQNPVGFPDTCFFEAGADVDLANCTFAPSADWNFLSWTFGVDHQFNENVFGYIKTSRGNRSGGHQIRGVNGDIAPFNEEQVTDIEVGLKSDLLDNRLRLNLAYFYGWWDAIQFTQQVLTGAGAATTVTLNLSDAKVQGLELEAQAILGGGLSLQGGAGWVKVNFDEPGWQQFNMPKFTYNVAAVYDRDLSIGSLNARLDWFWKGKAANSRFSAIPVANPLIIPRASYGVLGARIGLALNNGIEIAIRGDNLTKAEYFSTNLNFADAFIIGYPGTPRTWGVELTYKFQ